MKIYETAVKKPVGTALIFIGIVLIGIMFYRQLPVDLLPEIDMSMVSVMTAYPGAGAEDVETNVTRPLEDALNSTENIKTVSSTSKDNISVIMLEFDWGSDMTTIMNDVRDKVDLVSGSLPDGVNDPMLLKFSTEMLPVIMLSATANESSNALYKILDDQIAAPLNRISGVGTVSISGAPQREVQVNVFPEKLEAYNIPLERIAQIIAAENVNVPAGNLNVGSQTHMLRLQGELNESRELNDIIIGSSQGQTVYLKDVAVVLDTIQSDVIESYTNGQRSASIMIQKQTGANTIEIANAVREMLPELQRNLPPDIQLETVMDTSDNVKVSINSLLETILLALLIVGFVVLVFLGKGKATIIIMIAIPISLIGSFIYLHLTGNTINIITLSALSICIGMVVDDAIVVLENITSHIERGSRPQQAAIYGTEEVSLSVIASTLTVVAAFLPMTMVGGMAGIMFKSLGWMVSIIIILSMIVALTLTPMMSAKMLNSAKDSKDGPFQRWYNKNILPALDKLDLAYGKLLNKVSRKRGLTLTILVVVFIGGVIISAVTLKTEFMPSSDNNSISMTVELPASTGIELSRATGLQINKLIEEKYPEVVINSFTVGQADEDNIFASIRDNGTNILNYNIRTTEAKFRNRSIDDISDDLRLDLAAIPAISHFVVTSGGSSGGMGGGSTMDVEIFGHDFDETDKLAAEVKSKLDNIKGLRDVTISRQEYRTEYQIAFDREKLSLNGLNMGTAASAVRNRVNGLTMSSFREEGEEYDIRVRYNEESRQSIDDIENILIYNSMGVGIRVRDLGKVIESTSLPQIDRKDRQRIATVSGSIYNRALSDIAIDVDNVISTLDIPTGVQVQMGGSIEDQQESFSDLTMLLVVVILLVYIVMASQFESLTYPFIIIFSIPFAFIGSLLLLAILGEPLGIMGLIGLVMLVGMVVKNGIVLVDYINLNRERGMSIIAAVVDGGRSRLRPVLMTTLTTILGMIPLAVGTGQGSEMWESLGITIIGGMTFSTIVTLVLIPVLYAIFGGFGVKRQRKKQHERISRHNLTLTLTQQSEV